VAGGVAGGVIGEVGVVEVPAPRAVAMAWICSALSEERELMALMLLLAAWIWAAVLPLLVEVASAPWQLVQ